MPHAKNGRLQPDRKAIDVEIARLREFDVGALRVRGSNPQGAFWYYTREQVADMIDSGNYRFHVRVGLYDVPVRTYVLRGVKYIRTAPDDTTRDNLLYLDQCPLRKTG
jgi:hypothetical protein